MKTIFSSAITVSILIYLVSCSKKDINAEPPVTPHNIEVYEHKTNIPVQGASVKLKRCTKYDIEFGCQQTGVFASYFTGTDGTANISDQDYHKCDEGMVIEKPGYWPQAASLGRNEITPEGLVQVTIKKIHENNRCFLRE